MALQTDTLKGCRRNVLHNQLELFDHFAPQMKYVCQRYIPHNYEAEEVMTQAFLKSFAKIDFVRDEAELTAWLRDQMVLACLDAIFKKKKVSFVPSSTLVAAGEPKSSDTDWSKILTCNFSVQDLNSVLNSIDQAQSLVFKLFFIENYTLDEISELLDTDEENCKTMISLAKRSIQSILYKKCLND